MFHKANLSRYFILSIVLTVVLTIFKKLFYINDYIDAPQFAHFDNWSYCLQTIEQSDKCWLFNAYFITDTFWAFAILAYLLTYIKTNFDIDHHVSPVLHRLLSNNKFYVLVFLLIWGTDLLENLLYLTLPFDAAISPYFKCLVNFKDILYSLIILWFLLVLVKRKLPSKFVLYTKALSISILFLVFIALLLTMMEQGASLIIALLESPLNLLLCYILLYFLASIFAHYPNYLKEFFDGDNKVFWKKHNGCVNGGLITYQKDCKARKENVMKLDSDDKYFHPFRYFVGSMLYVAMIYALLFTFEKYIFPMAGFKVEFVFFIIILIWIYTMIRKDMDHEKGKIKVVTTYFILYNLSILLIFLSLLFSCLYQWSSITYFTVLTVFIVKAILRFYILDKSAFETKDVSNIVLPFLLWLEKFLSKSTLNKLAIFKFSGFIILGGLIALHYPPLAMQVNPINVILAYIHIFYGFVIICIKYYLYAKEQRCDGEKTSPLMIKLYANLGYLLLIAFGFKMFYNRSFNDHQHLQTVPIGSQSINIQEYMENRPPTGHRNYVASWGGGLRATYFNLLLLQQLQANSDGSFLNKTVAMSGVSGGMLGLGFYFSILNENPSKMAEKINEIGEGNFASTDIVYLLGHDRLPLFKTKIKDRSITAMKNYWNIISPNNDGLPILSYQDYWGQYTKNKPFPILLTNTAQTNGKYGIASSVDLPFDTVFMHSTNILAVPNRRTLPYFQALSTSERFPFFSATATIDGVGHFIDGGYFDNSGLQSLMSIRNYINNSIEQCDNPNDSIFIILNSKENMIDYLFASVAQLKKLDIQLKIEAETDYSAIINGVLNQDVHANYLTTTYLKNTLKDPGYHTKVYYLPYPLRYNDIVNYLGGQPDDVSAKTILDFISEHNKRIDKQLLKESKSKWHYAYPTLSRMLSGPTVQYYKTMMEVVMKQE
ncbi:MAG: hypothetical protein IPN86_20440 [Saprospiraceae bacterium]|nr:hypothetical protein [Saprospiraceae bacterium]